jgi:hypothetical protein
MQMVSCPHCSTRVAPSSDGECPSCLRSIGPLPISDEGWIDPETIPESIAEPTLDELVATDEIRSREGRSLRFQGWTYFALAFLSGCIFPFNLLFIFPLVRRCKRDLLSGKTLLIPNATVLMERLDRRPAVLYLRSFLADGSYKKNAFFESAASINPLSVLIRRRSYEEQLVEVVKRIGPVVAVGRPGEKLPELGASRLYLPNRVWKPRVRDLMAKARLVILRIGETPGVGWELSTAVELVDPEKFVIYFEPPKVPPASFLEVFPGAHEKFTRKTRYLYFDRDWTAHGKKTLRAVLWQKSLHRTSRATIWTLGTIAIILSLLSWYIISRS